MALVQTVNFITPVVDEPYLFGQIAAANSLSDVYAMGGRPLTALNVVCDPSRDLPLEVLAEILAGGADKIHEAGASLVEGHTVDNPELVYGLSVTGMVHPERMVSNAVARPGDRIVLTKPLGLGMLATAIKGGLASAEDARRMGDVMAALNRTASGQMVRFGVRAATDNTGNQTQAYAERLREEGCDWVSAEGKRVFREGRLIVE